MNCQLESVFCYSVKCAPQFFLSVNGGTLTFGNKTPSQRPGSSANYLMVWRGLLLVRDKTPKEGETKV